MSFYTRLCGQRLLVLAALYCAGDRRPLRHTDIRKKLEGYAPVSSSQLAITLNRLVTRGFVERNEGACLLYCITELGTDEFLRTCRVLNELAAKT